MIQDEEKNNFGLIFIGILIPLIFYCFLPMIGVDSFISILSLGMLSKLFILFMGLGVMLYTCYWGFSKLIIFPVLVPFFYQILYRFIIYYSPIQFNFRFIMLFFTGVLGFLLFKKYGIQKYLKPFIGLGLFYLINIFYTIINYAHDPNHLFNINSYLHKKESIIPYIYSIQEVIMLSFLVAGIYFSINLFKHKNDEANTQFNKTLIGFTILNSIICIMAYLIGETHLAGINSGILRINGFFTHSNVFAFFNVCSCLYLSNLIYTNKTNKILRYTALASTILASICVLLTFSRVNTFFLILFLGANYIIYSKEKFKSILSLTNIGIILIIGIVALDYALNLNLYEILTARINDESSSNFRPMVLKYLATQINPDMTLLYGKGIAATSNTLFRLFSDRFFVNLPIVYHPHNSYAQLFYDYGIIGLVAYCSTLFTLLFKGIRNININNKLNPNALILTQMLIFALAASLVDCYIFNVEMIPFWILVCIVYVNSQKESEKLSAKNQ